MSDLGTRENESWNSWERFWFSPASVVRSGRIRGLLCMITVAYFASCWSDAGFWYAGSGPFSPARVATFLRTSGLEDAAAWIVSPLFLAKSEWLYHLYLIVGMAVALMVAVGRGGSWALWGLWLMLIGWANRAMILSGLTETLLSLGLFASAIAPPAGLWHSASPDDADSHHWRAGFSQRLMGTQVTVVLIATLVTMLGGRVWFNGLGAYSLAAPASDRTIDWTGTLLSSANVHESLTHLMILALPVGLGLAWMERPHRIGQVILLLWCTVVALLGSHWLYSLTLAVMILAIQPLRRSGSFSAVRTTSPAKD